MNEEYIKEVLSLDGRHAVVTGGSSGIGRGIAVSLANFGARVTALGRNRGELLRTQECIQKNGGECDIYTVDVSKAGEVREFFQAYDEKGHSMDIFVANAGINIRAELLDTKEEDIDRLLDVNYKGKLYGVIEAGKRMKKQKGGNIIIISSVNGISAMPNLAVYSSIKYALEGITRSLASSLGPYGVQVNSCAPGVILTRINEAIYADREKLEDKLNCIPLRRIGSPQDIGDVVACMAGGAFRFMTGATVLVDGGELLRGMQKQ